MNHKLSVLANGPAIARMVAMIAALAATSPSGLWADTAFSPGPTRSFHRVETREASFDEFKEHGITSVTTIYEWTVDANGNSSPVNVRSVPQYRTEVTREVDSSENSVVTPIILVPDGAREDLLLNFLRSGGLIQVPDKMWSATFPKSNPGSAGPILGTMSPTRGPNITPGPLAVGVKESNSADDMGGAYVAIFNPNTTPIRAQTGCIGLDGSPVLGAQHDIKVDPHKTIDFKFFEQPFQGECVPVVQFTDSPGGLVNLGDYAEDGRLLYQIPDGDWEQVKEPLVIPTLCSDGKKDGTETDVDCGGVCGQCGVGKRCLVPSDCQTGVCTGCTNGICNGGGVCAPAACTLPNTACSATTCVDLTTDPMNCGGCAQACSGANDNPSCAAGVCTSTCSVGFANCTNTLRTNGCNVSLTTDPMNCGGCGKLCGSAQTCINGTCASPLAATCPVINAQIGVPFFGQIGVNGGVGPYVFSVSQGTLLAGLSLNATTGAITGTVSGPAIVATVAFQINDSVGHTVRIGCVESEQ